MGDYPRFLDALLVAGRSFCLDPRASSAPPVQSTDSKGRTKRYPSAFTGARTRREDCVTRLKGALEWVTTIL